MLQFLIPMVKAAIIKKVTSEIASNLMKKRNEEGEKAFWRSKKFLMAVLGVAIPALNEALGWNLSTEVVWSMVGPVMAYVGGQGLADFGKSKG